MQEEKLVKEKEKTKKELIPLEKNSVSHNLIS